MIRRRGGGKLGDSDEDWCRFLLSSPLYNARPRRRPHTPCAVEEEGISLKARTVFVGHDVGHTAAVRMALPSVSFLLQFYSSSPVCFLRVPARRGRLDVPEDEIDVEGCRGW
jgi:hypothetical protein